MKEKVLKRPLVSNYSDPVLYLSEMISYRKLQSPGFTVAKFSKNLRRVSPSLVSLILKRKRRITIDRVEELSKLLDLSSSEKFFFKNLIESDGEASPEKITLPKIKRKEIGSHILSDWLNIYVKDHFKLKQVQSNPRLLYKKLAHIAPPKRIDKALSFLLKEGHLRRDLEGRIFPEVPLAIADQKISSQKVKNFHKNALKLAKNNIDFFEVDERYANTATIALTEKRYEELVGLIDEFTEKFKAFAEVEDSSEKPDQIYQLIVNLSPTGSKIDE
ncbi:MAG: TIGR02147 family protein [Bdellovibrionales bacterium]